MKREELEAPWLNRLPKGFKGRMTKGKTRFWSSATHQNANIGLRASFEEIAGADGEELREELEKIRGGHDQAREDLKKLLEKMTTRHGVSIDHDDETISISKSVELNQFLDQKHLKKEDGTVDEYYLMPSHPEAEKLINAFKEFTGSFKKK